MNMMDTKLNHPNLILIILFILSNYEVGEKRCQKRF